MASEAVDEPEESLIGPPGGSRFPPPTIRGQLPPDLEAEFEEAVADVSLDELFAGSETVTKQPLLEPDSKHSGRVVAVGREDVFVELGGREQGILPLKQFDEPPETGRELKVRVVRFNRDDGLYELTFPQAAASVADWSDLEEGMVVEARVTGHNAGGLECEVNHIRAFLPVSQISLYRVEDLDQFVGEKFTCLVTEANPRRRNLVLSRRAVLEREKEEARKALLESIEPGQVRDGVVRRLMDFGAFIDLGGLDGLLHISQLGWGRVQHPSEVLQEGQAIQVKIEKIDRETGRISLIYRDMLPNPWEEVERKYPPNTTVRGTVVKLMEFGAFVELEPGVEGLIHISELSHKKVWRVADIVNEGDEVEVAVLSVDPQAQRIGLSMKHLSPEPEEEAKQKPQRPEESLPADKPKQKWTKPLRGGLGRSTGGEQFGLKW
jgi:small subunit ribosomal protein S1